MGPGADPLRQSGWYRAAVLRGVMLLMLWVVIGGAELGDLLVGLVTAALACWVSLRLLPPTGPPIHLLTLALLLARLPWEILRAGVDVARYALDPRRLKRNTGCFGRF
jgi:multicomponent Na+:H+ antiporter subunit E